MKYLITAVILSLSLATSFAQGHGARPEVLIRPAGQNNTTPPVTTDSSGYFMVSDTAGRAYWHHLLTYIVDTLGISGGGGANTDSATVDWVIRNDSIIGYYYDLVSQNLVDSFSVDLSLYLDNTDNQQVDNFSLASDVLTLEIEDDGQAPHTVDLSEYDDFSVLTKNYSSDADHFQTIQVGHELSFLNGTDSVIIDPDGIALTIKESNASTVPNVKIEQLGAGDAGLEFSILGDAYALGIDNTDDFFKIDYATPTGAVLGANNIMAIEPFSGDVYFNGTTIPSPLTNGISGKVSILGESGSPDGVVHMANEGVTTHTTLGFFNASDGSGYRNTFTAVASSGTLASPTNLGPGHKIFSMNAAGYQDGTRRFVGAIEFSSGSGWGVSNYHSKWAFETASDGETSRNTKMVIDGANIGMGDNFDFWVSAPHTNLHVHEANSDTKPTVEIQQTGFGDAGLQFSVDNNAFAIGIDNTSDDFKISYANIESGAVLGTNDYFQISPTSDVFFNTYTSAHNGTLGALAGFQDADGKVIRASWPDVVDSTRQHGAFADTLYGSQDTVFLTFTDGSVDTIIQEGVNTIYTANDTIPVERWIRHSLPLNFEAYTPSPGVRIRNTTGTNAAQLWIIGEDPVLNLGHYTHSDNFKFTVSDSVLFIDQTTAGAEKEGNIRFDATGRFRFGTGTGNLQLTEYGDSTKMLSTFATIGAFDDNGLVGEITVAQLADSIVAGSGDKNGIYDGSDTIPASTVATLSGIFSIDGANTDYHFSHNSFSVDGNGSNELLKVSRSSDSDAQIDIRNSNQVWDFGIDMNGVDVFSFNDITAGTTPFAMEEGVATNTLYLEADGDIGMGTNNPTADLHLVDSEPEVLIESTATANPATLTLQGDESGVDETANIRYNNTDGDLGGLYTVGEISVNKNHATDDDHSIQFTIRGTTPVELDYRDDWTTSEGRTVHRGGYDMGVPAEITSDTTLDASFRLVTINCPDSLVIIKLPEIEDSSPNDTQVTTGTEYIIYNRGTSTTARIEAFLSGGGNYDFFDGSGAQSDIIFLTPGESVHLIAMWHNSSDGKGEWITIQ